jgi:hypothetical protein
VKQPGKRPGPLWMFFYGRPRRGFPWLLVGLILVIAVLSLTFAIPGVADQWRSVALGFAVALIAGALAALVVAIRRPRRRR